MFKKELISIAGAHMYIKSPETDCACSVLAFPILTVKSPQNINKSMTATVVKTVKKFIYKTPFVFIYPLYNFVSVLSIFIKEN